MLVVRVELWSAVTGEKTEIARAVIANDGTGDADKGNYWALALRGRDKDALDRSMAAGVRAAIDGLESPAINRRGEVKGYPRLDLHVFNLVARCLSAMGYK